MCHVKNSCPNVYKCLLKILLIRYLIYFVCVRMTVRNKGCVKFEKACLCKRETLTGGSAQTQSPEQISMRQSKIGKPIPSATSTLQTTKPRHSLPPRRMKWRTETSKKFRPFEKESPEPPLLKLLHYQRGALAKRRALFSSPHSPVQGARDVLMSFQVLLSWS